MPIITLGGNVGAGKSHISNRLASILGYQEFNVSQLFRKMAAKEGLIIDEFYSRLKNDPDLERSIDEMQATTFKENDYLVAQGRLAWHFAAQSPFRVLNIFLAVDPKTATSRIAARSEYGSYTNEAIAALAAAREEEERARYKNLYGIDDHLDPKHYDLIVDTTNLTPEEVLQSVVQSVFVNRVRRS